MLARNDFLVNNIFQMSKYKNHCVQIYKINKFLHSDFFVTIVGMLVSCGHVFFPMYLSYTIQTQNAILFLKNPKNLLDRPSIHQIRTVFASLHFLDFIFVLLCIVLFLLILCFVRSRIILYKNKNRTNNIALQKLASFCLQKKFRSIHYGKRQSGNVVLAATCAYVRKKLLADTKRLKQLRYTLF